MMFSPGEVISYLEMCKQEGTSLQRGMNFRLQGDMSVILMSLRPGAPYADRIEQEGRVLIYEGHDAPRLGTIGNPKKIDQPLTTPSGKPTQNGLFLQAALRAKRDAASAEIVRVYEKIRTGIWVYVGLFKLVDAWQEKSGNRQVVKFKLELLDDERSTYRKSETKVEHNRLIPSVVKLEVWKRDKGQCVICGSRENLHFDHIIPFSLGGSSAIASNIQILCAKHNLEKHDKL